MTVQLHDGTRNLGKREQTKLNNREAILKAARDVFAELGYGATTVRDIIRKTGLASGTFYNYYKSKEEVFQALLDDRAKQVRPALLEARKGATTLDGFVKRTFRSYFETLIGDRPTFEVMRRNTGALRMRMETPELVAGIGEMEADVRKMIKAGTLPNVDPKFLTVSFVGVAFEMGDYIMTQDEPDIEAATEFASALFIGGLSSLPVKHSENES